jgi:hypothetical protein
MYIVAVNDPADTQMRVLRETELNCFNVKREREGGREKGGEECL